MSRNCGWTWLLTVTVLLLGFALINAPNYNHLPRTSTDISSLVTGLGSTNPSDPDNLTNEVAVAESYTAVTNYYYRATTTSPQYYHVFWVCPNNPAHDWDVFLYSDPSYSNLIAYSQYAGIDWVLTRPSGVTTYYLIGGADLSGTGYIEWDASNTTLSFGESTSGSLSASELVEVYAVSLISAGTYAFTLEVPAGGDFALYLYHLSSGTFSNGGDHVRSSNTLGDGVDEVFYYSYPSGGTYALLVVRRSGSGSYNLTLTGMEPNSNDTPIPFSSFGLVVLGICGIAVVTAALSKKFLTSSDLLLR